MRENQRKSSSPKSSDNKNEDVPHETVEKLVSYFKKLYDFEKYEKDITKKYKKYYKKPIPDRWPVEFINRAWEKTEKMNEITGRKKGWSFAILLQVMKRGHDYEAQPDVKEESPQSGGDPSAKEPVYIRIPFSEMVDGKTCYRSETDEKKNKENKASNTGAKKKESKASETDESPQEYKLIDKVPSPTQILQNQFYITLFDNQTRNAAWVYEILNKSTLTDKKKVERKPFKIDESVHRYFQAPEGKKPYTNTGYDRGHLAAAANHNWCAQALDDTYWLSNAVPQQKNFNQGIWLTLEKLCRYKALTEEVRNVHVYTGPLYLSPVEQLEGNNDQNKSSELEFVMNAKKKRKISVENMKEIANDGEYKRKKVNYDIDDQNKNKNKKIENLGKARNKDPNKCVEYECVGGKAVPTHLFKVIIVEKNDGKVEKPICYKIPNELPIKTTGEIILGKYETTMEDIQKESGLIFEESKLKEEITDETWKLQWAKNPQIWIKVKVSGSHTDHSDRAVSH